MSPLCLRILSFSIFNINNSREFKRSILDWFLCTVLPKHEINTDMFRHFYLSATPFRKLDIRIAWIQQLLFYGTFFIIHWENRSSAFPIKNDNPSYSFSDMYFTKIVCALSYENVYLWNVNNDVGLKIFY